MDDKKQPGISFENIILKSLEFYRKPNVDMKAELNIDLKYGKAMGPDNQHLTCELEVSIKQDGKTKEESSFTLTCCIVGMFSIVDEEKNMDLNKFAEVNAPAAMFPYLREVVTNVTMRSGIKPILLPPVNLVSLIKDAKPSE